MLTRHYWYNDMIERIDDFLNQSPAYEISKVRSEWSHDEKHNYLKIIAPGFSEENIKVEVKDSTLFVSGTQGDAKNSTSFSDRFLLDRNYVDQEAITAEYKAGILTITMPFCATAQNSRQIKINSK
jgi:HSP20 family molecular chaperone IbpA